MKTIYLVRHGQTIINKYDKIQGWCDTPLTDKGIADAKHAGEVLKNVPFDIALSSDLGRAVDTCNYIIERNCNHLTLQHIASPFFREQFFGFFEGMNSDEAWQMIGGPHGCPRRQELLLKEKMSAIKDYIHEADPYHDAEDNKAYWERLDKGFKLIKELDGAENILLVSHSMTIRSIVSRYAPEIPLVPGPANGSITILKMNDNDIKVTEYNKTEF